MECQWRVFYKHSCQPYRFQSRELDHRLQPARRHRVDRLPLLAVAAAALRLGLGLLNPPLLSYAIRGERIVVNGNERVVIEIRLMVYRHQRVIRHDESPTGICGTPSDASVM